MALFFSNKVADALHGGQYKLFNFLEIMTAHRLYLSDYVGEIVIDGKTYLPGILSGITRPPKTGKIGQEVQTLQFSEGLADFSSSDIISILGKKSSGATVIVKTYLEDSSGELHVEESDIIYSSEGILKKITRTRNNVAVEFSNAYGKLDTLRELRTTRGSLDRLSTDDTSFDRADVVDDNITLDWGT